MPTQVNKPAVGFLGLVEAKQMGKNPSLIVDQIVPNIDMLSFWAQDGISIDVQVPANVVASQSNILLSRFQVPQNESWLPLHMSLRGAISNIGVFAQFSLSVTNPPRKPTVLNRVILAQEVFEAQAAGAQFFGLVYSWPQREVLPAGVILDTTLVENGVSTIVLMESALHYIRLPA